ncbi:hypothetical protein ACFY64_09165 [Streptomyces collinus]
MFSIIVAPPPTTEDERNRTPITRARGAVRMLGTLRPPGATR